MTTDQYSVAGRTAIVTGASSGIGEVIAKRFADDGANVVICSREMENVEPVAEEIDGNVLAVECDVTDREAVDALIEATVSEFGGLDILVNNAGASFMARFDDITPNGWSRVVEINLAGTYHCTQAAGEHLKADGESDESGTVVNIASVAGQKGSPFMTHYGAAKAGIINLTRSLSYEWASEGVRVNCVAPGFVATPGLESQMGISADEVHREDVHRQIGLSEEIADVVQFLASPAASFVVGETITAEGVPDVLESPEL